MNLIYVSHYKVNHLVPTYSDQVLTPQAPAQPIAKYIP